MRNVLYKKRNDSFLGAGINNIYIVIKIENFIINLTTNSDISASVQRRRGDVTTSGPMKSEPKLVGFIEKLLK